MSTPVPVRLQRSRAKGSKLVSPNGLPVVCVSRPSKLGNPFAPGRDGPLGRRPLDSVGAVGFFADMLRDAQVRAAAGYPSDDEICRELVGKNLVCWCKLCDAHRATGKPLDVECRDCDPCHVDPLGEMVLANGAVIERRSLLAREA